MFLKFGIDCPTILLQGWQLEAPLAWKLEVTLLQVCLFVVMSTHTTYL